MLRLQLSLPSVVILILILNLIMISLSAPISEEFEEIDLPTDDISDVDLSQLSDSELYELERALQNKIEEFENEQEGFVEDSIPIPRFDDERRYRKLVRNRRAGARSAVVPVLNEDGAVELFPITDDEQPIVVIEEPPVAGSIPLPLEEEDRQFVLVPEIEDEADLIPIEIQAQLEAQAQQESPMFLSNEDIDELQLRQRLAELGDQLSQRAMRGL